jgi:hypothetical protein
MASDLLIFLGMLFIIAGLFFCVSAIVMALYNYTIPRLLESTNKNYNTKTDFRKIDFWTGCSLVLLCSALFGGSNIMFTDRSNNNNVPAN